MFDPFILKAAFAGIILAIVAGPLGCLIYWKRMSFFGDAISHTSLFGVILGIVFGINLSISLIAIVLLFSLLLFYLRKKMSNDSSLTILAQGFFSFSLIIIALLKNVRIDLYDYILGDILLISDHDLLVISGLSIIILLWIYRIWEQLLLITINQELAKCYKIKVNLVELQFTIMIALFVALSIKFIGILLISAILVIPAATARFIAKNPEQMAIFASLIASLSTLLGLTLSYYFDLPSGPAIISSAMGLFMIGLICRR